MKQKNLRPKFVWQEWKSEAADFAELPKQVTVRMLFDVFLINRFELALLELKGSDAVWGPVHTSVGQEAVAAGTVAALSPSDKFSATYRSHHQFLSKALQYHVPLSWDPVQVELPEDGLEVVRRTMAEIMGLESGYCGGRGGSMHLRYAEAGFLGSNAIVAGGLPLAAGAAYAEKFNKSNNIIVSFVGDGALHQGALHEALNMAGKWKLPLICFIENNLYAVATSVNEVSAVSDLSLRAVSYDMDGYIVDGNDVVAVYSIIRHVAEQIRSGGRPAIIEAKCYRRFHHAGDVPGSAYRYRSREEEKDYSRKEVINTLPNALLKAGILNQQEIDQMKNVAENAVLASVKDCSVKDSKGFYSVKNELWPDPESASDGVRSTGKEWEGISFLSVKDFSEFETMQYSDAIAGVTGHWFEKESGAIIFGEEVANLGGGAYGATKGLVESYSDRVINTPISEGGFAGLGFGAAQLGMKVIVEIMFADFALVAADQLFNQISKGRHMYGNTTDVPLVIRTRIGTGLGYGAQHSMDPVGLYGLFPGFRIVAPANSFDYIGLFNSAMQSLDPVVILEHNSLYTKKFPVPTGKLDFFIPFGQAEVIYEGSDLTLITYGNMVERCKSLIDQLNENNTTVEVIDLKTLDHLDIDYETIGRSVGKTGAVLIVEEAAGSQGIGAVLSEQIQKKFFDDLDSPVAVLSSLNISTPVSKVLESAAIVSDSKIVEVAREVANRRWL